MKYILKYISVILFTSALVSCALEEPFEQTPGGDGNVEIEFIARPTNFVRTNVATKADADEIEAIENNVYSAYFLFYDGNGQLIRYENITDRITDQGDVLSQSIITDKGMSDITVCYIANMPESFVKENMTDLSKLQSSVIDLNTVDFRIIKVSETGIVGIPAIDVDDSAITDLQRCMPMVGIWNGTITGESGKTAIEIPVKRLFSRVDFTIRMDMTDGSANESSIPSLKFSSIVVNNIPRKVNLFPQEEESDIIYETTGFLGNDYKTIPIPTAKIQNKGEISFFFYVPEYIVYPITEGFEEERWYKARDQKYKPELIGKKKATNVRFEGILNKLGQDLEVDYTIYLGENNFDDFSLKRNYLYDNTVSINGTNYGNSDDSFGVDHRVNIKYTGFLVGFQRATLLDSHFEVRPLRVKFSDDFIKQHRSTKGTLKIEILPETDEITAIPDWIRLERPANFQNPDQNIYCGGSDKINKTKRKYFTTDLIETLGNQGLSVSYNPFDPVNQLNGGDLDGEVPVWVYIDEYTATSVSEFSDTDVRRARIRVSFTPNDGSATVSQDFTVQQRAIYPIPTVGSDGQSRTYGIEYFEEYLHNYDSQDNYGAEGGEYFTSQNGIKWGFDGVQFSDTDRALYFTGDDGIIDIDALANYATADMNLFYDFYLKRDRDSEDDEIVTHDYSGYDFNLKIIEKEGLANIDRPLNQNTQSAIEYCYNKNKRNADGTVIKTKTDNIVSYSEEEGDSRYYRVVTGSHWLFGTTYDYFKETDIYNLITTETYLTTDYTNMKWYAPAIDELEDIVVNSIDHEFFSEVFVDNLYWSAQPAYDRNYFQYIIGVDKFNPYNGMSVQEIINWLRNLGIDIPTRSRTYGIYMSDKPSAARATKYDPYSSTENKFISSDLNSEDPREGFYKGTTLYGTATVDNYIYYPNNNDGDYVFDQLSTFTFLGFSSPYFSIQWEKGDVVAMTSYKKSDGVTDILLPEGIQNRSSEHRVRCIYQPVVPETTRVHTGTTTKRGNFIRTDTTESNALEWYANGGTTR